MKITGIRTYNIGLKLKKPLSVAKMVRERSSNTIVKIETDEGVEGYGEATFAYFFAGETQGSVSYTVAKIIAPALEGYDPTNILELVDRMNTAIMGNPFAKAAVEMALWDIKGKVLGTPIYNLLGGCRRKVIPVNHSVSYGPITEMVEQALSHADHGFKALKIYCGRENPAADLERVTEIRKAVGNDMGLYVEANERWDFKTSLHLLSHFEKLGILFVEQPIPSRLTDEMRILRQSSFIPIAADEGIFTPEDVMKIWQQGTADIVNIYVLKGGGILGAKRAIDVAETVGLNSFIGSFNELSISTAAGAHLSAVINRLSYPCYLVGPTLYEEDIIEEPLEIRDGMFCLSDRPGLGIKVMEKKLKRFSV